MGRRANGDGNINKLKNGTYKINLRDHGIRKSFYGKTEREAREKCRRYQIECLTGVKPTNFTVSEAIETWLTIVKKHTVKPSSYDRLERTYERYIRDKIGNIPIKNLTAIECQRLINEKVENLSYSTVKKIYQLLDAFLNYFMKSGDIGKNPMDIVEMPLKTAFTKSTKEIIIPTEEEMERLIETAELKFSNGGFLYVQTFVEGIKILKNTGMRLGELLALTWEDISFDEATITISKSVSEVKNRDRKDDECKIKRIVTNPKTKKGYRQIHINPTTIESLKKIKGVYEEKGFNSEYVIVNLKGKLPSEHDIERTLDRICKRANIRHFTPHEMRHYFASRCIANKMDIHALSKHMGHANITITMKHFVQPAQFIIPLHYLSLWVRISEPA